MKKRPSDGNDHTYESYSQRKGAHMRFMTRERERERRAKKREAVKKRVK